ncbi:steroid 17-alpha-hydroxylase/17,20 lyase isoform X2 [Aquila chrysaetos chrysaetos]|uniref:steroid 17-alpha-hydroxylase/17,20 lyase isoform X2 n=1 Tax=Aquila chrysaetos chrysaetos TaxID=223781 RepID=UPI001B7D4087|nr:steroid 17-alpha-hydroxylase/17,20 lyase isoform X2 [Aquila chrysaetos chrysaetos]
MIIHPCSITPLRHTAPAGLPCVGVTSGLPVPQVTTDLLSRGGKDIAFASYGPLWKFQRKLVHAALSMFGEGSLALERIICREAASLCETLSAAQDTALDVAPELTRAVTNVVCSLCFNSSYRRGDPEFEAMLEYSQGIVDTVAKESLVDIFPWLQIFPNKDLALLKRCLKVRDQLLQQKFTEHKEAFCRDAVRDLMDALLQVRFSAENSSPSVPGLELTDDHLLMTVGDIFGAGVETTTTVLKWAVIYLLHYPEVGSVPCSGGPGLPPAPGTSWGLWGRQVPREMSGFANKQDQVVGILLLSCTTCQDMPVMLGVPHRYGEPPHTGYALLSPQPLLPSQVQRKIQEEIDQKIGLARHPHLSDRPLLPYLEATISEVLRIRPVSPLLIPHVSLADTSIGEYSIPKGARVVINLWSVHHDEKEWDKPEEFNPGRFLDEHGQHIHSPSPSYLPFGAGIRVCLGEVLAKMELFLFLAWVLQRFTLECPQDQPLPSLEGKFGVVLQVQKFQVKARLRDAWRAAS